MTRAQLLLQDPQLLLCKAALQLLGSQHALLPGVTPLQMQDFGLALLKFSGFHSACFSGLTRSL